MRWSPRRSVAGAALASLLIAFAGCDERGPVAAPPDPGELVPPAAASEPTARKAGVPNDASLEGLRSRLRELRGRVNGKLGVAIVHVESGRRVSVGAEQSLPLQSVFKLPLAVAILREVQAGRVRLDERLEVAAEDRAPGHPSNQDKWTQLPRTVSVLRLLEYALVDSDNTSSDKLLELLGGPTVLSQRMQQLGFPGILVEAPTKAMGPSGELPNRATAAALAGLLASLQRGETLRPAQRDLLWRLMRRSRTRKRRIRAGVPPGAPVVSKTGTGRRGAATNDAGVVTLPDDRGHLAIAVLISGSSLSSKAQEDLIARIAREAFDEFAQAL